MKYEVLVGFDTKNKRYEVGDIIEENNIPKKSKSWLTKENIVIKIDAKYEAKKLEKELAKARKGKRKKVGGFTVDKKKVQALEDELKTAQGVLSGKESSPTDTHQMKGDSVVTDYITGKPIHDKEEPFDKSEHMKGATLTTATAEQQGGVKEVEPAGLHGKHGIPENEKIRAFLVDALATEEAKVGRGRSLFAIQNLKSYIQTETDLKHLDQATRNNYLASSFATRHQGGPIKQSGGYELLAGEMVWDQAAVAAFGKLLNEFAYEKVGMGSDGGGGSTSIITDASSPTTVVNNTNIIPPNPKGQMLPGSGRDLAVSHFRNA